MRISTLVVWTHLTLHLKSAPPPLKATKGSEALRSTSVNTTSFSLRTEHLPFLPRRSRTLIILVQAVSALIRGTYPFVHIRRTYRTGLVRGRRQSTPPGILLQASSSLLQAVVIGVVFISNIQRSYALKQRCHVEQDAENERCADESTRERRLEFMRDL
jgi:hypothetical protein